MKLGGQLTLHRALAVAQQQASTGVWDHTDSETLAQDGQGENLGWAKGSDLHSAMSGASQSWINEKPFFSNGSLSDDSGHYCKSVPPLLRVQHLLTLVVKHKWSGAILRKWASPWCRGMTARCIRLLDMHQLGMLLVRTPTSFRYRSVRLRGFISSELCVNQECTSGVSFSCFHCCLHWMFERTAGTDSMK
jgi:hypothetical protein